MRKDSTEVVFILDKSGSMSGLEADTMGGFNSMLKKQRKEVGEAVVSTLLFDTKFDVLHNRVPIEDVPDLVDEDYVPGGATALLDAVGRAITHIEKVHRKLPDDQKPEHTMFVITTDGEENSSTEYQLGEIRRMIERLQEADNWVFLFLGANIDAIQTAGDLGISADRSANFCADSKGTAENFAGISCAMSMVRGAAPLNESWKDKIDADFGRRGTRRRK